MQRYRPAHGRKPPVLPPGQYRLSESNAPQPLPPTTAASESDPRAGKRCHVKGPLRRCVAQFRCNRASVAGLASICHAVFSGGARQMAAAALHIKCLSIERVNRAGCQTGLVFAAPTRAVALHRRSQCVAVHRLQCGQGQGKPVGMPQTVLRVDTQHQRAGVHRFAACSPLLKRVVARLFRWPGKRVQGLAVVCLGKSIAHMPAPAVQGVRLPVMCKG